MSPSIPFRFLLLAAILSSDPARAQLVREAAASLSLPSDLPSATGYTTVNALGSLTFLNPMATAFPPGETNRLYVLERGTDTASPASDFQGRIQRVDDLSTNPTVSTFMDLEAHLESPQVNTPLAAASNSENGMLSFVFHPNYNENGYFYVYFSLTIGGQLHQRLARFQATGTPGNYRNAASADPATMMPILTIRDAASNHNGGDLAFGPDGYLYLSLGDEGGGGDQFNTARFINKNFWGQLLRLAVADRIGGVDVFPAGSISPNSHSQPTSTSHPSAIHPGTYRIPADNPFIGFTTWHGQTFAATTVRTEIYATGLRNPFRFSFDPPTGRLFLADVGQGLYEEVNLVTKGGNYGWSWREGKQAYYVNANNPPRFPDNSAGTTNVPPPSFDSEDPIFDYGRTDNGIIHGVSICGGIVYRGNQLTELQGKYLVADTFGEGGIIAAFTETSPGVWTGQRLTIRAQIVDFGTDPSTGEPLLCSLLGTIWRITRTGTSGPQPPATLSATGAFSNTANLTPATGLVAYEPNVSFWSDGAVKSRWFAIRNTTDTFTFSERGNWTFPTGMVWVKHFDLDVGNPPVRRRIETRFLVKTAADVYGLSYRWENIAPGSGAQTDAALVAESGLTEVLPGATQTWRFPSRGECRTCHTAAGGFALSFNTHQLNRTGVFGAQTLNQLTALGQAGYCSPAIPDVAGLPAFAAADDSSQSLAWRARSYLSVNCVGCHQPGGPALGNWDARITTPLSSANLITGPLVNHGGDPLSRFLVRNDAPAFGEPTRSMVLRRIRGDGVPRMPPLATYRRDLAAEALLTAWINEDPNASPTYAEWQTVHFASTTHPDAEPGDDPDGDGQENRMEFIQRTHPRLPQVPSRPTVIVSGESLEVRFLHPSGRPGLMETSTDLETWAVWNVPGNLLTVPAENRLRTFTVPRDETRRFFRFKLEEP
jgi:glucose/arabinose dehydrogenase